MNPAKNIGRFAVYILFFALTWVLNLTICGIIGTIYYNEDNKLTVNIYSASMLLLPAIASTLQTRSFIKKWAHKRQNDSNHEPTTGYETVPYAYTPPSQNTVSHATSRDSALTDTPSDSVNEALVQFLVDYFNKAHSQQRPYAPRPSDIRDDFAQYGGIDAELLTVDLMDGHDFENWCANALRDLGFVDVEVTAGSGDQGVDIVASKDGVKYAIQCKRYTSDLGNTPVQEVHAGKKIYRCHVSAVVTNRYFTSGAKELAEATGVLLWDRGWITQYLKTKVSADGSVSVQHTQPPALAPAPVDSDYDEFLPAAIDVIIDTEQASVSMLQRKLILGYERAVRVMDKLEKLGVVGSFQGNRPRKIYITRTEWNIVRSKIRH